MAAASLRVLLAENRLTEAGIILRSLCAEVGWSLELIFVAARADLEQTLPAHRPDVVLLDLSMLQPDATARLGVLHQANPAIPLILFADPADIACAVKCLSMGAKDFLLEGFMDERIMARVLRSAIGQEATGELTAPSPDLISAMEMKPHKISGERSLPGPSLASSQQCALFVCLENLEHAQLQVGAQAVDRMLEEFTQVLRKSVRVGDLVVPVSRGQIMIFLPNAGESCSAAVLQRIRARVKNYKPSFLPNLSPTITVQAGNNGSILQPLLSNLLPSEVAGADFAAQSACPC
jgi:DNA-binding NarL/FixJ family response regulator